MLADGQDIETCRVGKPGGSEDVLQALLGADAPAVGPVRRQLTERVESNLHRVVRRQMNTAGETPNRFPSARACRALISRLPFRTSLTFDWEPKNPREIGLPQVVLFHGKSKHRRWFRVWNLDIARLIVAYEYRHDIEQPP